MDKLDAIFLTNFNGFDIYETRNKYYKRRYIIWNKSLVFENGHTHVVTLEQCITIISNVVHKRVPERNCKWSVFNDIILSHIRLTDDELYINHLLNIVNHKFNMQNCKLYINERRCFNEQIS